jgi:lipoyl(octanoyl) transferase
MPTVFFRDLGCIDYQAAWDYQTALHQELTAAKLLRRTHVPGQESSQSTIQHYLLFCEHPPVYTLGKSGSESNLLLSTDELVQRGFQYFKINRGGDITYHGPGQIVGYPIFDLDDFFTDVHRYVRTLEEAIIQTLAHYDIESQRVPQYTGVWLPANAQGQPLRKICAIGVHLSRWVTMHGFAFNVNTNLNHFSNIVPCGIADDDKAVTSMQKELGREVNINEVKDILKSKLASLFVFDYG